MGEENEYGRAGNESDRQCERFMRALSCMQLGLINVARRALEGYKYDLQAYYQDEQES